MPPDKLRVSRVAHLDAALLDSELETMLVKPLTDALEGLYLESESGFVFRWIPEVRAAFRGLILYFSLARFPSTTYGTQLMNLRYRNEYAAGSVHRGRGRNFGLSPLQKVLFIAGSVLGPYIQARAVDLHMDSYDDEESSEGLVGRLRVWAHRQRTTLLSLQDILEKVVPVMSFVNFAVFLRDGKYPNLLARALGMRLVYADHYARRRVSFEFMNRQLVWEAFTEFVLFLAPLVSFRKLMLKARRAWKTLATLEVVQKTFPRLAAAEKAPVEPTGRLSFLSSNTCPICFQDSKKAKDLLTTSDPDDVHDDLSKLYNEGMPDARGAKPGSSLSVCVPYVANCTGKCRYSYYCIVSRLVMARDLGEPSWECLRCGKPVTAAVRESAEGEDAVEDNAEEKAKDEGDDTIIQDTSAQDTSAQEDTLIAED